MNRGEAQALTAHNSDALELLKPMEDIPIRLPFGTACLASAIDRIRFFQSFSLRFEIYGYVSIGCIHAGMP